MSRDSNLLTVAIKAAPLSTLAALAQSMSPGSWAQLTGVSGLSVFLQGTANGNILGDSNKGAWDPGRSAGHGFAHFVGQDHGMGGLVHVQYDETTNGWTQIFNFASQGDTGGHGLDHICCNQSTGDVYFARYNNGGQLARKLFGQAWDINAIPKGLPVYNITYSVVFWSGALTGVTGGAGAVVVQDPDFGQMAVWDVGAQNWTVTTTFLDQSPGYDCVGAYSPDNNFMVGVGGGNPDGILQRVSSTKVMTQFDASPLVFSIRDGTFCENPKGGSGTFLSLALDGHLWELNVTGASLVKTDRGAIPAAVNGPAAGTNATSIVIPIRTYGVMMVVSCDGGGSANNYLYKPV